MTRNMSSGNAKPDTSVASHADRLLLSVV
jgi:hypothetical protein